MDIGKPPSADHGPHSGSHAHPQSWWLWVMCLTGVDYFSTLGYQPSIAYEATGVLTPFATMILVLVTLFGAYPVYSRVAARSFHGQGSIAMLERLLSGWWGKTLVLVLLGFAATDFVITKTLSAADAAAHVLENPVFWPREWNTPTWQIIVTMILLVILGGTFLRGFKEVIGLAVGLVAVYLVLNLIVVGSGLIYLYNHPSLFDAWLTKVQTGDWSFHTHFDLQPFHGSWVGVIAVCVMLFPKLALGLSGFETGVAVMPLIKGDPNDSYAEPAGKIRSTRRLLLTAALIMSVFLLGSSTVVSILIAPEKLIEASAEPGHHAPPGAEKKAEAANRALAYLAHGGDLINGEPSRAMNSLFSPVFGTVYDLSTVLILWFAGASAMAGLLNLVPQYLPRYGMAPEWARAHRPLVLLFTATNLFVTWQFNADVHAQGSAYATGVLVLICSACVASLIDSWERSSGEWYQRLSWPFLLITIVFVYTTILNVYEKPDGIKIATWFIFAIVASSVVSRLWRTKELRFQGLRFKDEGSRFLWDSMKLLEFPALVPHRPGTRSLKEKERAIRKEHRLGPEVPVVFLEAHLGDVSDFYNLPTLEVIQEEGAFILRVTDCASIAHTIAALALELSKSGQPPEIHFGWSDQNALLANLGFVLFGEGNVPMLVRELVLEAEPNLDRQPRVIIG